MNTRRFDRGGAASLLQEINNGGTHEEHEMRGDPNQGVPISMNNNGDINSVEEDETIYTPNESEMMNSDESMVFSDRIIAEEDNLVEANLPAKYAGKSYSAISKILKRNSENRTNDRISLNTLNVNLERLSLAQESQKAEEEFESMGLEQKISAMDRLRQDSQQDMQNQANIDQMQQQQPSPEEMAMQEQMMAQNGYNDPNMQSQPSPEEMAMMQQQGQPMMSAYGGRINRFGNGGISKILDYISNNRNNIHKEIDSEGNVHYVDEDGNVLQGGANAYNNYKMAQEGRRNIDIANYIGYLNFLNKIHKGIDYSQNDTFERQAMNARNAALIRNNIIPQIHTKPYSESPELIREKNLANYRMLLNNIYNSSTNPATATSIALNTGLANQINTERDIAEAKRRNMENVNYQNNINSEIYKNNAQLALEADRANASTIESTFRDTTPSFQDKTDRYAGYNSSIDSAIQGFVNNRTNKGNSLLNIAGYNSTNGTHFMDRNGLMYKSPSNAEQQAEKGIGAKQSNNKQSREYKIK